MERFCAEIQRDFNGVPVRRETIFGLGLALAALLVLWLLNKMGLLHENVSASIVTASGTVVSQDGTGLPQFDLRLPSTFSAAAYAQAVWPLCGLTVGATAHPDNPAACTCPSGFTLYHEVSQDSYLCLPQGV